MKRLSYKKVSDNKDFRDGLKAYIRNHEFKRNPSKMSLNTVDRHKSFTGLKKSDV